VNPRRLLAALALLAGALPLACGNKTALRPPGMIQPRPATSLEARSTPTGVTLSWRRPVTYTGGSRMSDLGGFDIDRAPAGGGPEEYLRVGTMNLEDQQRFRQDRSLEFTDTTAIPDMRYSYRVVAFTLDGYRSEPAFVEVLFSPSKAAPEKAKKKGAAAPAQVDHSGTGQ